MANYGIMDQMAVLQWAQENVENFGGDKRRVTLFGHGTGAACIEYLAHSPTTVPGRDILIIRTTSKACLLITFSGIDNDRYKLTAFAVKTEECKYHI